MRMCQCANVSQFKVALITHVLTITLTTDNHSYLFIHLLKLFDDSE